MQLDLKYITTLFQLIESFLKKVHSGRLKCDLGSFHVLLRYYFAVKVAASRLWFGIIS